MVILHKPVTLIFVLFILGTSVIRSQDIQFNWVSGIADSEDGYGRSIDTDSEGNVYTTGFFNGTVVFDPSGEAEEFTSNGLDDIYLAKYDPDGNLLWANTFGSPAMDKGYSVKISNDGHVVVTGYLQGTIDFDPSEGVSEISPIEGQDVFLAKFEPEGNLLWAKVIGGADNGNAYSIQIDQANDIFLVGAFAHWVDLDPSDEVAELTAGGSYAGFLAKYDPSGNYLWGNTIGDGSDSAILNINIDSEENIIVIGNFSQNAEFNPSPGQEAILHSEGSLDIFLAKYDPDGNYMWAHAFGGIADDYGYAVKTDSDNNIYLNGAYKYSIDFDPSEDSAIFTSNGFHDAYLAKFTPDGNYLWAQSYGNTINDFGWSLDIDENNNVYSAGYFVDSISFDVTGCANPVNSNGSLEAFIAKHDSAGNYIWGHNLGGTFVDAAYYLHLDQDENLYVTGYFSETADFDPSEETATLTSTGGRDIFLAKYSCCQPLNPPIVEVACDEYTWETAEETYFESGLYDVIITDSLGCDSIAYLDLSINSVDTSVVQSMTTLSATAGGATYQWLNCEDGFSPIEGATSQSFTATENGTYAVEISQNDCVDTSACFQVIVIGVPSLSTPQFKVYPNPAKDYLIIETENSGSASLVEVYNAHGKMVKETRLESAKKQMDIFNLANGIYWIRIQTGDRFFVERIVKE